VLLLAISALLLTGALLHCRVRLPTPTSRCRSGRGSWGVVSSFPPPPRRNRVFYAGSLKQARKGAFRFNRPRPPYNPVDSASKYGVLGVFYKATRRIRGEAQSVEESAAGNLTATITLGATTRRTVRYPPYDPRTLGHSPSLLIDKRSLVAPVKTLSVTTAFGTAPAPPSSPPETPTFLTVSQRNRTQAQRSRCRIRRGDDLLRQQAGRPATAAFCEKHQRA